LFGINGSIALACLLAAISGIFWGWQYEEWRSLVSAVGAGLGALLAAVSPLIRDAEAAAKWILTIGAIGFSVIFSVFATGELTRDLREQQEVAYSRQVRLLLLKQDIVDYATKLQTDERERLLATAGTNLRSRFVDVAGRKPPFHMRDFDPAGDLIEIIRKLDPDNGHDHYISGEIERLLGGLAKGRPRFYAYLESEKGTSRSGPLGAIACRNAKGFCRERTAWIFHLLANDFYAYGKTEKEAGKTSEEYGIIFKTALQHACSAITLFPPNGFADALQLTATRVLETRLSRETGETCPRKSE
jgi:hypothetical protein